ncbi:hypothetical protein [Peptacetobacter hiranonis]|uniref:hypothetical protein n=1 Tax=Peptacetobacter hiranonis TaxID=89152 RepID=UPI0011E64A00|nr:hypothetical protein [Peptacetobacter hiranonis]QEK20923.1 hypothetical protein KGNDJEFE_01410 [Peptacetobacter hiranonis]
MYQYDDYINLENSLDLPTEIRGKCVRVVSVLENLEDIVIVHKFKLYVVYVVNEKYIVGINSDLNR